MSNVLDVTWFSSLSCIRVKFCCFPGWELQNRYVQGVVAEYASVNVDIHTCTFALIFVLILWHYMYLLRYVLLRDIFFSADFLRNTLRNLSTPLVRDISIYVKKLKLNKKYCVCEIVRAFHVHFRSLSFYFMFLSINHL